MKQEEIKKPAYVYSTGYDRELAYASVGSGWKKFIDAIFDKLLEPRLVNVNIVQVKEKWGILRVYTDIVDDELDLFISKQCSESANVCEECGAKAELINKNGWYRTLCKVCLNY